MKPGLRGATPANDRLSHGKTQAELKEYGKKSLYNVGSTYVPACTLSFSENIHRNDPHLTFAIRVSLHPVRRRNSLH